MKNLIVARHEFKKTGEPVIPNGERMKMEGEIQVAKTVHNCNVSKLK